MYRGVLVALKPERPNDLLISYAIELATQYSLRLVGIAVLDTMQIAPPEPVPLGGTMFKVHKDETLIERTREHIGSQLREFSTRCRNAGIPCDVISEQGDMARVLAESVQRFDLLMDCSARRLVRSSFPTACKKMD